MVFTNLTHILIALTLLPTFSHAGAPDPSSGSVTLNLNYKVKCDETRDAFPAITGELTGLNRMIRFQLFKYINQTNLTLSRVEAQTLTEESFRFFPSKHCSLQSFTYAATPVPVTSETKTQTLAKLHSPFVVIRHDQIKKIDRDVPMGLSYGVIPHENDEFSIVYHLYFSNETVRGPLSTSKPKSLGSYGRRSDVEWVYAVRFNSQLDVIERSYQGGILLGMGHLKHRFNGRFVLGTDHPILYNFTKHNVFSDTKRLRSSYRTLVGYHLSPETEIYPSDSREVYGLQNPWTFDVTDRELLRTGTLSHPSNEYLYVRLSGELNHGKIFVGATDVETNEFVKAGEGKWKIGSLTDDLFNIERFTAIHLGENFIGPTPKWRVEIFKTNDSVNLNAPRFYKLVPDQEMGFVVQELTQMTTCKSAYDCAL